MAAVKNRRCRSSGARQSVELVRQEEQRILLRRPRAPTSAARSLRGALRRELRQQRELACDRQGAQGGIHKKKRAMWFVRWSPRTGGDFDCSCTLLGASGCVARVGSNSDQGITLVMSWLPRPSATVGGTCPGSTCFSMTWTTRTSRRWLRHPLASGRRLETPSSTRVVPLRGGCRGLSPQPPPNDFGLVKPCSTQSPSAK